MVAGSQDRVQEAIRRMQPWSTPRSMSKKQHTMHPSNSEALPTASAPSPLESGPDHSRESHRVDQYKNPLIETAVNFVFLGMSLRGVLTDRHAIGILDSNCLVLCPGLRLMHVVVYSQRRTKS
jgi:hypothetical protein